MSLATPPLAPQLLSCVPQALRTPPLPPRRSAQAPWPLPPSSPIHRKGRRRDPLPSRGHHGAPYQAQRLLGGMVSVELLPLGHRRDVPDGGDLCFRVSAVYEVVVEGVLRTFTLARPQQRLVGVGPRKLEQRR